jgi:hypothetical protein
MPFHRSTAVKESRSTVEKAMMHLPLSLSVFPSILSLSTLSLALNPTLYTRPRSLAPRLAPTFPRSHGLSLPLYLSLSGDDAQALTLR